MAPTYLCDELRQPADTEARRRLRSASSTSLDVRRTRLSTVGDRAFPVAATRLWNCFPSHVTAVPSLSIFCCRLRSHLFSLSHPTFLLFSHLHSACAVIRHFGHYIIAFTCNSFKSKWCEIAGNPSEHDTSTGCLCLLVCGGLCWLHADLTRRDSTTYGTQTGSRDRRSVGTRGAQLRRREMRLAADAQGRTIR